MLEQTDKPSVPPKRPLKVFLCHASADKPKVRELYRYLKKRGIQPWLDAEDLLPGQNWQTEIPKAIESSDAIIICLSKGSVDKEGYVQKEIKFALDKALQMPEDRIFLIPARLEECELPRSLRDYHWVDLFDDGGKEKLMKSLKARTLQMERTNMVTIPLNQNNSKLVINAVNPVIQEKGFSDGITRNTARIDLLNTAPGTIAEKTYPTVSWYTMDGKLVTENHGRWWISNDDLKVTKNHDQLLRDLLSNGMSYGFHFAIQEPGEPHFYAWYRDADGKYGRFFLTEKKYKVKIRFSSNNGVDANFVYIITNDNGELSIKESTG